MSIKLQDSEIKRITDAVIHRQDNDKFSKVVSKKTIQENEYNLNIPRYVDSSPAAETWDLHATMLGGIPNREIAALKEYWDALPELHDALFSAKSSDYSELAVEKSQVQTTIAQHPQLLAFIDAYNQAFDGFDEYLNTTLIKGWESVNRNQQQAQLSVELFKRMQPIALVDKYQAYQLLSDQWQIISADLEMMQTEGFKATTQVDPNMIIKKVKGKETEVQDGWKGHIMPFDLVQKTHLNNELLALAKQEARLAEITSLFEEVLESLSDEEKEAETVKESGDGFANAQVSKEAKVLAKEAKANGSFDEESYEAKIIKVAALIEEEKKLKKAFKEAETALHLKTKKTIEELTDSQVNDLLELKWITPLCDELINMPSAVVNRLTSKVQSLADKYAVTYSQVANEIQTSEHELAEMMGQLKGNEFDMQGLAELTKLLKGL
ncbi:N-6 DNA methylase, partial [Vibrio sp. D173a]|uniref:N-6 DNA methylase n=1 Tax=Vibrio sp. D173a TaxID=2836349 RepID=UPI002552AA23